MRHLAFAPLLATLVACGGAARSPAPAGARPARVIQVFTEPSAVAAVVPVGGSVFVATSQGLDRWDTKGSRRTRLGPKDGVAGAAMRALTLDRGNKLWFGSDTGVGYFDIQSGKGDMMPPPPAPLLPALAGLRYLAPDGKGGVWVAAQGGLFHAGSGGWSPTSFRQEITALFARPGGALWIGTRDGIFERSAGGLFAEIRSGSTVRRVSAIAEGPDGATVVLGEDSGGETRFAVWGEGGFSTYRLSLAGSLTEAAHREGGLILAGDGHLIALHLPDTQVAGSRPDTVDILHVDGGKRHASYIASVLDYPAPPDTTAMAAGPDVIYLGTRTLGTSALSLGAEGGGVAFLRPRELVAGARGLSVACRTHDECYLATGGTTSWRYDGHAFSALVIGDKQPIVLAVVRNPQGEVLALYREPSERRVHVAKLAGTVLSPVSTLAVETPSGAALLSFAQFGPDGLLWLGLQYIDEAGDVRPFGVATVDLGLGAVTYHHEGAQQKTKVLPVPNDVVAIAFSGDETWFASASGAARLRGENVHVYTEADALKSEILRGIVATEGGLVFVASSSGVGQFDGKRWTYPEPLAMVASSIARGLDGKLWIGTEKGLVAYDGKNGERLDRAGGLLDDRIFDVEVDFTGRVWARGTEGISLVTP